MTVTQRQALYSIGGVFGGLLLLSIGASELSGIGSELRAYPARLAQAKALGLDLGAERLLASDATKPIAARRAFDELEAFLRDPRRFNLPKPSAGSPTGASPIGLSSALGATKAPRTLESYRADLRRLGMLSRAAEGGSHFDWSKGYELLFPSYAPIKNGAKVADALTRADAACGDYTEATQNLLDSSDVWRAYGQDPVVIADFVRTASAALLFRTAGRLLADPGYPPAESRRLAGIAEGPAFAQQISAREFLLMEASMLHDVLNNRRRMEALMGTEATLPRDIKMGLKVARVRRAWQSDALRLLNDAIPRLPADPYDFNGTKRVLEQYGRDSMAARGLRGRYTEVMGGSFYVGQSDAARKRESTRRVLLMAAGLRAGENEATLRKRLGRFGLDPYDGKPLRVKDAIEAPRWLSEAPALPVAPRLRAVYSIGQNGSDEGGRTGKRPDEGDLVLVIPR